MSTTINMKNAWPHRLDDDVNVVDTDVWYLCRPIGTADTALLHTLPRMVFVLGTPGELPSPLTPGFAPRPVAPTFAWSALLLEWTQALCGEALRRYIRVWSSRQHTALRLL